MKVKKYALVWSLYLLCLISFLFLRIQETTSIELATAIILLIVSDYKIMFRSQGSFKFYILIFILYVIVESILSYQRYGQGIVKVGYCCIEYLSLFLYLYYSGNRDPRIKKKYPELVIKFSRFLLVMLYIYTFFGYIGIRLLDSYAYRYRGTLLRINVGDYLLVIGIFLTAGRIIDLFNQYRKVIVIEWIWLILFAFYLVFVSQTRMQLLGVVISIGLSYIFCVKNRSKKIIIIIIGGISILVFLSIPIVQNYLNSTFGGLLSREDNSIMPRIQALIYYVDCIKKRPLFGWGFANVAAFSNGRYDIAYLFRGPWGLYYTDDVGIIGVGMEYGLIGVALYIALVFKMGKIAIRDRFNNSNKFMLFIYVLVTAISLSLFDVERQGFIVIILVLMEAQSTVMKE